MILAPCRTPEHLAWLATHEPNPTRWPGICWNHVAREIERETDQRRRLFPHRVTRGLMTQAEAVHQIAIFEALSHDVARIMANARHQPPSHHFSRQARIDALLRERDYRARLFPKWVETGQITPDQAIHRNHCLAMLLETFDQGLDFDRTTGDINQLMTTYQARWLQSAPERGGGPLAVEGTDSHQPQKELAL